MKEPPLPCPERPGPRAKDHCDYLLDSIDAQLNQLQAQVHNAEIKGSSDNEMASFNGSKGISNLADLGGCPVNRNVDASSEKDLFSLREEYTWRLSHLLDLEGKPDDQSQSDSVRTEDFAAKFKKGLVDPLLNSDGEEDVFAGRILPSGLGPLECSARDWAEKVDPSQLWEDPEVVADLCSTRKQPLKKASEEELEQVSALDSKDPPSLVLQSRVRSLESLGGKISSFCKESSNDITNTARDHSARERILFYRPLGLEEKLTGLEMGVSGETAFGGTQQRRDGLEDSFEQIQDARENSISPFIIEDLSPSLQTAQGTALGMSMSDAGASPRKVGQSCQGERQHDCPRDLSDIACLCPINVPHKRCVLVSSGEVRGGFSSPGCMDPLITFDIGKRQRPAPSRLKTSTCGTNAPGDFQQPLGLGCEGRAKQNRTTIACTERHGEALERMAYGDLSAECHKPQCGLNSGCRGRYVAGVPLKSFGNVTVDSDLDSVRTEECASTFPQGCRLYQQGHSTEKPHSPQSVSGRNVGSSDTGIKEEEQKEASELLCQSSSPRRWTPRETEDLGWKRTKREACSSCKASPGAAWHGPDPSAETFIADLLKLEESIMKLQQDLKLEEEKLLQKKSEIRQADVTLHNVLQEKKHVALELGALHKTLEESYKEAKRLDLCLKQHQTKVEEARADLVLLEYKRDACLRELMELEKELSILRRQRSQYGVVHAEVSRLVTEREELDSQVRHQKLQLRSCKAEVAAMQETAGARTEQLQEVVQAASELDRRTRELEQRVLALQKILSEKELELLRLHKTIFALEAEKERWDSAVESLKQEHKRQVEKLQVEAVQEKERDFAQLQKEKQQLVQELTEKTEQTKTKALQEQASTFQKEVEDLRKIIEDRDAELARQQEATHQQARKLKQDAEEKVQSSLLQEQQKWEADAKVALHMQKETLEEQCRNTQTELQEALEEERRSRYALQAETDGLHKRIQELETQAQLLQGEKRTALEELRVRLQEEKAQALSQLREELEQERNQMRARLQQIELDRRLLQAEQQGAFPWEQGDHTHAEWTDRSLAREVTLACQRLQHLLPKQAGTPSLSWMFRLAPSSNRRSLRPKSLAFLSTSHALQALQEVSEETQCYLQDLKHEIETQKHNIRQLQREKEEELRQQQERLRQESQANLEALKDHLVQEHMKDIATLQRSWVKEKRMGEKHVLLKQLQEKDEELRAVQRNMACWKDETARKLAHKFQKQLDAELEQCHSKDESMDIHRQLETTESEIRVSCMNLGEDLRPHSVGSLSLKSAPLPRQHNFGTPKLLHHLQSQIQALRSENTLCLEDVSRLREGLDTTYRSKRHLASDLSSTQLHGKSIRN